MSILYIKEHVSICPDSQKPGQLQQLLKAWTAKRNQLQTYWHRYKSTTTGHHVSYRAWSRYGAYLEAQQEIRKH